MYVLVTRATTIILLLYDNVSYFPGKWRNLRKDTAFSVTTCLNCHRIIVCHNIIVAVLHILATLVYFVVCKGILFFGQFWNSPVHRKFYIWARVDVQAHSVLHNTAICVLLTFIHHIQCIHIPVHAELAFYFMFPHLSWGLFCLIIICLFRCWSLLWFVFLFVWDLRAWLGIQNQNYINSWSKVKQHLETFSFSFLKMPGGYPAQGRLHSLVKPSWATELPWQWSEMTDVSVCNSWNTCIEVFFKTEILWLKSLFLLDKQNESQVYVN